jgi:hypothetical protein
MGLAGSQSRPERPASCAKQKRRADSDNPEIPEAPETTVFSTHDQSSCQVESALNSRKRAAETRNVDQLRLILLFT